MSYCLKVSLRVRQFFCFWKLFVALNNCANFFCDLTNLNGSIGLQSCRFRAISAFGSRGSRPLKHEDPWMSGTKNEGVCDVKGGTITVLLL